MSGTEMKIDAIKFLRNARQHAEEVAALYDVSFELVRNPFDLAEIELCDKKLATLEDLQTMALNKASGQPFGSVDQGSLKVWFVMTDSPSLGRRSHVRFTYYLDGRKVTKQAAQQYLELAQ